MSNAVLQVAVQVVTAITDRKPPDPAGVATLRIHAPHLAGLPVDELACHVVTEILKQRAASRQLAATSSC